MSKKLLQRRGVRRGHRVLALESLEDRQLFDGAMVCEALRPIEVASSPSDTTVVAASAKQFVLDADGDGRLDLGELKRWMEWWGNHRQTDQPPGSTPEQPHHDSPTVLKPVADYGGAADWHLNDVNAPEAWAAGHTGEGVVVAVIDTGADLLHPELRGSLWANDGEIAGNGVDDDRNGYVDDTHGWDFVNDDNRPQDRNGHGTHVASLIAGARDGRGTTGVADGAEVMVLQGLGANGVGSTRDIAEAIRYAVDEGADIINLSLSGASSNAMESAIRYAEGNGVLVIAASGNKGAGQPSAPASFSNSLTNVLAVGAVDEDQDLAKFSNRPTGESVMVHAPGVRLRAAVVGGYATMSGTSMAAPMVAGVAALAKSAAPQLSATQLRDLLVDHAMRNESDWLLVDAAASVGRAIDIDAQRA